MRGAVAVIGLLMVFIYLQNHYQERAQTQSIGSRPIAPLMQL